MNLSNRLSHSNIVCLVATLWITVTIFIDPSIETGAVWSLLNRIDAGVVEGVVAFAAIYVAIYVATKRTNVSAYAKYLIVMSIGLGATQTIGANFNLYSAFRNPGLSASANAIDILFRFVGWSLAILVVSKLILSFLEGRKERGPCDGRVSQLRILSSKYFPLFAFFVCLACWTPYLAVLFPGVVTSDTIDQINQGLGFTTLIDHHPFVHSMVMGQLVGLGRALFGSIYAGVIVATVFQMVALSAIFATCVSSFENPKARLIGLAFFSVHPVIAWYSVTLWKDVLYSGFILLFAVSLFKLCSGGRRNSLKWLIVLFVASLGTLVMKKSGLFIVAPAAVVSLLLIGRGERARLAGVCGGAIAVFFAIQIVAVSFFGVTPGKGREALSVPLQQIARTVTYHGDEIDGDTAAQINAVLPYDELKDLYNPTLSDPVKGAFNDDAFNEDPASFISAYIKLGCTYPGDYTNAFLNSTYGYWYPDVKYWMVTTVDYVDMLDEHAANSELIYDEDYGTYTKPALSEAKGHALSLLNSLRSVPVVSCLFSIGFWVWIYCFLLVIAIRNRLKATYVVFVVVGLAWVTCLMSPLYAEMRYAFALLLMLPIASWCVVSQWFRMES